MEPSVHGRVQRATESFPCALTQHKPRSEVNLNQHLVTHMYPHGGSLQPLKRTGMWRSAYCSRSPTSTSTSTSTLTPTPAVWIGEIGSGGADSRTSFSGCARRNLHARVSFPTCRLGVWRVWASLSHGTLRWNRRTIVALLCLRV